MNAGGREIARLMLKEFLKVDGMGMFLPEQTTIKTMGKQRSLV